MNAPRLASLLLASLAAVPTAAYADTVTLRSRVDQVTVFPSAAQIHRTARAQVRAGEHQLVFAALPTALLDDSLRVTGFGPGVTAEAVNVRTGRMGELMAAELEQLQGSVAAAQAQLNANTARSAELSLSMRQLVGRRGAEAELARAQGQLAQLETQRAALARAFEASNTALSQAQARASTAVKFVTVEVTAAREGDLELGVEYLVHNVASWRPAYSAYLRPDLGHVGLDVFAALQQSTGEDWENVRMAVSTVTPSTSLTLPTQSEWALTLEPEPEREREVAELNLELRMRRPMATAGAARFASGGAGVSDLAEFGGGGIAQQRAQQRPPTPLEQRSAVARAGLLSARLELPAPVTLRSGATPRRILAAHSELEATLEHQVAPRQSTAVFLAARMRNRNAFPLLAGNVALFVDRDYVGTTALGQVPVEEELALPFGVDPAVTIDRTPSERQVSQAGGRESTTLRYAFRLSNHRERALDVSVFDQLPVSRSAGLTVQTTADTRAFAPRREGDARGAVRWQFHLGAGATERWNYGFTVSRPQRRTLDGDLE